MKKYILLAVIVAATSLAYSCSSTEVEEEKSTNAKAARIARGEYLVKISGCGDCHSPKIMTPKGPVEDSAYLLAGFRSKDHLPPVDSSVLKNGWALFYAEGTAMVSPMGISYAANITADETGIGNWTLEQFKTAMTEGKWKGLKDNRQLLPPMPWQNFTKMHPEDLEAIYDYLQSTKPVENIVPMAVFSTQ
ncbi:diheme cytochrome c-553 [Sediminibacterium sp.]|uniref:diheme cytochrome c-553 n=1 Tax=Sediminibacterium sp. TaxID=1917865 RepID=UPI003F69DCED